MQQFSAPLTFDAPFRSAPAFECCLILGLRCTRGLLADTSPTPPFAATLRALLVLAPCRYPPGGGNAQMRPSISPNSRRFRCPSANNSQ